MDSSALAMIVGVIVVFCFVLYQVIRERSSIIWPTITTASVAKIILALVIPAALAGLYSVYFYTAGTGRQMISSDDPCSISWFCTPSTARENSSEFWMLAGIDATMGINTRETSLKGEWNGTLSLALDKPLSTTLTVPSAAPLTRSYTYQEGDGFIRPVVTFHTPSDIATPADVKGVLRGTVQVPEPAKEGGYWAEQSKDIQTPLTLHILSPSDFDPLRQARMLTDGLRNAGFGFIGGVLLVIFGSMPATRRC